MLVYATRTAEVLSGETRHVIRITRGDDIGQAQSGDSLTYLTTGQLECEKARPHLIELSASNMMACGMLRRLSPAGLSHDICRRAAAPRAFLFTRPLLAITKTFHPVHHLTRGL
jgi:hypothetical protein